MIEQLPDSHFALVDPGKMRWNGMTYINTMFMTSDITKHTHYITGKFKFVWPSILYNSLHFTYEPMWPRIGTLNKWVFLVKKTIQAIMQSILKKLTNKPFTAFDPWLTSYQQDLNIDTEGQQGTERIPQDLMPRYQEEGRGEIGWYAIASTICIKEKNLRKLFHLKKMKRYECTLITILCNPQELARGKLKVKLLPLKIQYLLMLIHLIYHSHLLL